MPREKWKAVDGFPLYEVSSLGRVRSLARMFKRPNRAGCGMDLVVWPGREIKGWLRKRAGLPVTMLVSLRRDGQTFVFRLHRLVLESFVGSCPHGMEGCHNDGNPCNNAVANLRWDSHLANQRDQVAHGTKRNPPRHGGETHPNARLTDKQIAAIRAVPSGRGVNAKLARDFGTTQTTIGRIRTFKTRAVSNDTGLAP